MRANDELINSNGHNMIQEFSLKLCGEYSDLGQTYKVIVDDKPLLDMIAEYELQYSDVINGDYIDVLTRNTLLESLKGEEHQIIPLGCSCGDWQCWFLVGTVTFYQKFVFWGAWSNPYRGDKNKKNDGRYWCYKDFPILVFDKQQYETEIRHCLAMSKNI